MNLGRRGFIVAMGLGAAAGPSAAKMASRALGQQAVQRAPGMGLLGAGASLGYGTQEYAGEPASAPWTSHGITEAIWNLWNQEARDAQQQMRHYLETAIEGKDPVHFACKSWSPAFGISYTFNKITAMKERAEELDQRLWKNRT